MLKRSMVLSPGMSIMGFSKVNFALLLSPIPLPTDAPIQKKLVGWNTGKGWIMKNRTEYPKFRKNELINIQNREANFDPHRKWLKICIITTTKPTILSHRPNKALKNFNMHKYPHIDIRKRKTKKKKNLWVKCHGNASLIQTQTDTSFY